MRRVYALLNGESRLYEAVERSEATLGRVMRSCVGNGGRAEMSLCFTELTGNVADSGAPGT
jgi:hypothetical protein